MPADIPALGGPAGSLPAPWLADAWCGTETGTNDTVHAADTSSMGIKVVSDDSEVALDVGCALKRTVIWLVLACPAGLGLLSALFDRDHRGLHDHFAGTRVVRATA